MTLSVHEIQCNNLTSFTDVIITYLITVPSDLREVSRVKVTDMVILFLNNYLNRKDTREILPSNLINNLSLA